jgi:uncharacterized protein (DUF58 family)
MTEKRGIIPVGPLQLEQRDPLGLLRSRQDFGESRTLVVHPRVHPVPALPSGVIQSLDGPTADSALTGSITFQSLRHYVFGDDLRRVHWKSTARTGDLMVREHVDTSRASIAVLINSRHDAYNSDNDFEEVLDAAASLAVAATAVRFPISLFDGTVVRASSDRSPEGLLDQLALVQREDGQPFDAMLDQVSAQRFHDTLVVFSGQISQSELSALSSAKQRFSTVVAVVIRADIATRPTGRPRGITVIDATTAADAVMSMGWLLR